MLGLVRWGLRQGADIKINWLGRLGVWPVMSALFAAMAGLETVGAVLLYIGRRDGRSDRPRSTSARASADSAPLDPQVQVDEFAMLADMDTFPDLGSLSDQELKDLIQQLTDEEQEVSYRRRILHGKIDILRAELVNRLRKKHEGGEDVISGADVQRLTDILAGRAAGGATRSSARERPGWRATARSAASSSTRERTTAPAAAPSSARREPRDDVTTATYIIDEQTGELRPVDVGDVAAESGALVIRSGGGRVGQSFPLAGERMTIGRSPEAEIFLDDVTVSRDHAVLVRRSGDWYLDDSGSLNGTYVNRHRIDSHKLEDGDELQIGKYKLTYLAR